MKNLGELMTNMFDDIEDKLREILSHGIYTDREKLFNLGIELGRRLNKNKIDNLRLNVWSDREQNHSKMIAINKAEKKIEELIAKLVRLSILHHINATGSWSIARGGGYALDKFSDEIVKKFNIQVVNCEMERDGDDFTVNFEVTDELATIFSTHKIYKRFDALITNHSGDNDQKLYDISVLRSYISCINAHIRNRNGWELNQYEEFLLEIGKPFTFDFLTYSHLI